MKRSCLAALWVLTAFSAACGPPAPAASVVTLGAVVDRTGSQAWTGWTESVALAEEHANAALKASKYKNLQFKVAVSDSANDPATAVAAATDLIRTKGAKALISDSSQNDIAINDTIYDADTTNDLAVPNQCAACTSGSINNPAGATDALKNVQGWNFRGTMTTKLMAPIAAKILFARGTAGDVNGDAHFKVAIYASDESFGTNTAKDVKAAITALDPLATVETVLHPSDADANTYKFSDDLAKLMDNLNSSAMGATDGVPDAVVVASFPQYHAATVSAWISGGYVVPLFHFHNMRNQQAIAGLGSQANGQEGISHALLDNGASGEVFADGLKTKTGSAPAFRDSTFYDGTLSMMLAVVIATRSLDDPTTVTPTQIRDALKQTSVATGEKVRTGAAEFERAIGLILAGTAINYEGASGPMDYDANQSVKTRLSRFTITGNVSSDVERFDCVASDSCPKL